MKLLFAAGDVGGARALLPIAKLANACGDQIMALEQGAFRSEGNDSWMWLDLVAARTQSADAVLYATSVNDANALDVAAAAKARGTCIVHVLDNWSNYAARLRRASGGEPVVPDVYAVMDQLAFDEALESGVPEELLIITGHPNLAHISVEAAQFDPPDKTRTDILFVSEPVRADSGVAMDLAGRGYDEHSVADALMKALVQPAVTPSLGAAPCLHLVPHPREDRDEITAYWQALVREHPLPATGPLSIKVVPRDGVRAALHGASHVMGMSSILLYEAWLLGRPTASIQPGLSGESLRSLSHRAGLVFCDTVMGVEAAVQNCLKQRPGLPQAGLRQHATAANNVLSLLRARSNLVR
jgi:hypothetical protein